MKKLFFISMLVAIVSLASCQKQDELPSSDGKLIFRVTADDGESTRAVTYRYILEIYKGTDVLSDPIHHIEQNNGNFTVSLDRNASYVCLFWADGGVIDDNVNGSFDATSLKEVKLVGAIAEAFFANTTIAVTTTSATQSISLKRAVAKVNLVEEGIVPANTDLKADFNWHTSFNASNGEVLGDAVATSKTFNSALTTGLMGTFLTFCTYE